MQKVKMMKTYARLIAEVGLNASNKQDVHISANVESYKFVRYLVAELYNMNVKKVTVTYNDDGILKLTLQNSPLNRLDKVDNYIVEQIKEETENKMARLTLVGSDPTILRKIKSEKKATYNKAVREAIYPYLSKYNSNELTWCIAGVPTKSWAQKVFPNETPTQAYNKLWEAIYNACHIYDESFKLEDYQKHIKTLTNKADILTNLGIKTLHITTAKGTDLRIGLPKTAVWKAANSVEKSSGHLFVPNIPTEEVYTSPDWRKVDGIVYSTKPLHFRGDLVNDFWIKFKNGVVEDFGAKEGYETLKSIITFDSDANKLGEIAIVPHNSAISNLNIVFSETLYDENASCHLALGNSFAECVKDGENLPNIELINLGLNISKMHCDFMIGDETMKITVDGADFENKDRVIFDKGEWVI